MFDAKLRPWRPQLWQQTPASLKINVIDLHQCSAADLNPYNLCCTLDRLYITRPGDLPPKGAFSLQTGHTWDPQELAECLGSGCSGSFLGQNCKTTLILKTVLDVSQT